MCFVFHPAGLHQLFACLRGIEAQRNNLTPNIFIWSVDWYGNWSGIRSSCVKVLVGPIENNHESGLQNLKFIIASSGVTGVSNTLQPGTKALDILGVIKCLCNQRIPADRTLPARDEILRLIACREGTGVVDLNTVLVYGNLVVLSGSVFLVAKRIDQRFTDGIHRDFRNFLTLQGTKLNTPTNVLKDIFFSAIHKFENRSMLTLNIQKCEPLRSSEYRHLQVIVGCLTEQNHACVQQVASRSQTQLTQHRIPVGIIEADSAELLTAVDILFERVLIYRACQAFGNFALPYTFVALPLHNIVGQFLLGHYLIFICDTDSGHIIGKVRCVVSFKTDMDTILIINMDHCDFRVDSRLDVVRNLLADIP